MIFRKPSDVRRSFERDSAITAYRTPYEVKGRREKRLQRTNLWPGSRLNYAFLEQCKQVICRVAHPTNYFKRKKAEYRLSVLPWGRGAYVDLRMYKNGEPSPTGILLHLDVISALLPDLIATVRELQAADEREPDRKASLQALHDV